MLERATTETNAGPAFPGARFSAETAAVVRSSLGGAIPEMIEAIGRAVPEYARPNGTGPDDAGRVRPDYQQRLADAVTGAVASFIARVAQPDRSMEPVLDEFRVIGGITEVAVQATQALLGPSRKKLLTGNVRSGHSTGAQPASGR